MAEFTVDELWTFLGLPTPGARNDVSWLMRAKARAQVADRHPASKPALAMIDRWLGELVEAERQRRIAERQKVLAIWSKYNDGMNTLDDLIGDLKDLAGYDGEE